MKITKSKKLAPATPELSTLLGRIAAASEDDLPEVLDSISEWCWPRGDLHYWIGTLNRFDSILEKIVKEYEIGKIQVNEFTPLCKRLVLSVLRFSRLLIENCTNRKLYASYEHLNDLLLTRDIDVLEATLRFILRPAQQRSSSSHSSRNEPNISHSRLTSLAVTWPTVKGASDMGLLCQPNAVIPPAAQSIQFSFYRSPGASSTSPEDATTSTVATGSPSTQTPARTARPRPTQSNAAPVTPANVPTNSANPGNQGQRSGAPPGATPASGSGTGPADHSAEGLVTVDISTSEPAGKSAMDIFTSTVERYSIPETEHFDLFQRIRVATSLSDPEMRRKVISCRLLAVACYAHIVSEHSANSQLFFYERELVSKTANMIEPGNSVPQEVKAAAVYALDAMGRYRTKLPAVLNSVQASVSHGLLVRVLRDLVDELSQPDPPTVDIYVDSVFGFTAFLSSISSPTGTGMAMSSAILPLLIKLVATPDPEAYMVQRTITRAVGLIDSIISSQPPAYTTYTNARGLETMVSRIQAEVDRDIRDYRHAEARPVIGAGFGSEDSPYGCLPFGRASLLRHLLKSILHDLQGAGTPDSMRLLLESTVLDSVKRIMQDRKTFGPQILALAINIMATFVHNEPTALSTIQEHKLPQLFLDCIEADIEPHFEVIIAIPNAIGALSLNQAGLDMFTSRPIIGKLLSLFTSERHIRVLQDEESATTFGGAIDELVRHQPSMKDSVFSGINEMFDRINEAGKEFTPSDAQRPYYGLVPSDRSRHATATDVEMSGPAPAASIVDQDASSHSSGHTNPVSADDEASTIANGSPRTSEEHNVLAYIKAMARFLEMLFQTPHHCKDFLKSDGLSKLLSLYNLPCLPADFYNHLAGDAIVQLMRLIADASPNAVFQALFRDIKTAIDAVPLDFRADTPGASQLLPTISAADEQAAAKNNELYKKSIALCMRVHLLGDCLHTYTVPGHKLPSGFVSSLFAPTELKALELRDLGLQFRFWTWEYLQVTAAKAERLGKQDRAKDGHSSSGLPSGTAEDSSATSSSEQQAPASQARQGDGEDDIPEAAIDGPSSTKKPLGSDQLSSDPELANLDVWQEMSGAMSTTIRDFFQELTRLLLPRRSSEASSLRRYAPTALDQIAKCLVLYYKWTGQMEEDEGFPEIGYATIILRHTQGLLYDERGSSSTRTQTQLIFKFFQLEGFDHLDWLAERFHKELTKHFKEDKPDQSGHLKHALKFHHICGALRILLSLLQNLSTAKLLHESAQTAILVQKEEPKTSPNYFEPAEFLVKVRARVIEIMRMVISSNWLCHLPVTVNRLVIQTLLEILRGEGEAPIVVKKDDATVAAVQAAQDRFANSILSSLGAGSATLRRAAVTASAPAPDDAQVRQLSDMGFPAAAARHALVRTNNDITAATEYLIMHPEVVQSMQDDSTETSTPANESTSQGQEAVAANDAATDSTMEPVSSAAGATASAPDADTAMSEEPATRTDLQDSAASGDSEAPGTEDDQPFTAAGLEAKRQLDLEREARRTTIFQHTLELADHHEDLVFEVRDAFGLVASDHSRAGENLQSLLGIVLSAGAAALSDQEKQVAVRMRALAVILNDDKLLKLLDDETLDTAMSICMVLLQEHRGHLSSEARYPTWFASNLLTIAALLTLEGVVAKVKSNADEERVPLPIEQVLPALNRFVSQRATLLQYSIETLKHTAHLQKEDLLALFRVLVLVTRRRSAAAELLKANGLALLFQPFRTIPATELSQLQALALIILRNLVEDAETLRATMSQELQTWMSLGRTKSVDVSSMTRQLSHVVMRDPEMFLSVAKERLQMTEWSETKENGSVRFIQQDAPASTSSAQAKSPVIAVNSSAAHDADASFGGLPASPTKGAAELDLDASMHELGHERVEAKTTPASESAEVVIHYLLAELYKSTKDAAICRNILAHGPKSASTATTSATETSSATAPTVNSISSQGAVADAVSQQKPIDDAAAGGAATSAKSGQQDATYLFSCFLMQTLMELLSSYSCCKQAFVSLCRRRSGGADAPSQPRLKLPMLQYFLNELIPAGFIRTEDETELRKRMALTNLAMSVIVALTADVAVHTSLRETPNELVGVRRFVLDGIIKALRDAVTSTETVEVRYGRIYAQADLCHRLLTARPNVFASKPAYDASLHMAKTMLEKHVVTVLTSTLAEVDLKTPIVKPLLDTLLRPLEFLTKAAIKMGKAERQAKEDNDDVDDMSSEDSETESESLSTLEEEALLERDQRQDTPDFYRNSSLGMHTGEMEQQPIYDDEEMEDEDEMEDDDVDMGEYDSDEEGSDLSSLGEEVEMDDDDLSDEDSDDESDSDEDDEEEEDDEMDDDEDGDVDDDGDSWATEDGLEEEGEEAAEATLDFVLGDGEEADDLVGAGLAGEFIDDGSGLHDGMPTGLPVLRAADVETEEDALSAEEPYQFEELAHLEFADDAGTAGRGQADDRFGANWGWASLPPSQLVRDSAGGPSHLNAASSRSRRRFAMLDPALHGTRPAASGESAAYHPLLEPRPQVVTRHSHSHRSTRRLFVGNDSRQDINPGFMHSFEEMMGTGTMQLLENLVGLARSDSPIRIDVSGGPGGLGRFRVEGDAAVIEQLFGMDPSLQAPTAVRSSPKQEDPVAMAQQFNPLPTGQRWSEAARIVHGTDALERSQSLKGHIISVLFEAYKHYKAEEDRKRVEEQEQRLKNIEARAKDIEEKMSQSLTLNGVHEGATDDVEPEATTNGPVDEPSDDSSSNDATIQTPENGAPMAVPTDDHPGTSEADVDMADGEHGTGTATPRASTPRPGDGASSIATAAPETGNDAADATHDAAAQGDPDATSSAQPTQRQFTYVHGQRIDITDTGIDPSFLEALPDDMREEVLNQHFRERRAAATTAAAATSSIAPEFLDALPPEIRAEVIQQEALENARRRAAEANARNGGHHDTAGDGEDEDADTLQDDGGGNDGVNPAALLASLNPALRSSMLHDDPEDILAGLQSTLLGSGTGSRRRHHHRSVGALAEAGQGAKAPAPRDAIQLLDKGGVATLIRLLYFPEMNGRRNGLYNILSNLSENARTRADLLSLLLGILSDGTTDASAVDRSFSSLSVRASRTATLTAAVTPNRPTPKRSGSGMLNVTPSSSAPTSGGVLATSSTAPISVIGDEAPFLIATRVLEALLHLTTVNEQAATFFLKEDSRLVKKGPKGKDRERPDGSSSVKAAGTAPVNTLLTLLKRSDILANAQLVDALLAVLNTVTRPLITLQLKKEEAKATETTASDSTQANDPNADSAGTLGAPTPTDPSATSQTLATTASAPDAAAPVPTSAADGPHPNADVLETAPHIAADRLAAVVRPLATPISSKGFQHTLSVASHLASIDGARDTIGAALKSEAEAASHNLIAELDKLLDSLPSPKSSSMQAAPAGSAMGTAMDTDNDAAGTLSFAQQTHAAAASVVETEAKFDSPALTALASPSSAQAVFLRSLRALDYLMTGR